MRWAFGPYCSCCVFMSYLTRSKLVAYRSTRLSQPDRCFTADVGWVLLSVKNSQQSFDSYYSFKSFLALVLAWFSLRMIWARWPELFPWFEKVFFWTAVLAAAWLFITTAGRWVAFDTFVRFIPRQGAFPNQNIAAGFPRHGPGVALPQMASSGTGPRMGIFPVAAGLGGLTESRGSPGSDLAIGRHFVTFCSI